VPGLVQAIRNLAQEFPNPEQVLDEAITLLGEPFPEETADGPDRVI